MSRWRNRDEAFGQLVRDNQVFMHDLMRKNDSVLRQLALEIKGMASEIKAMGNEIKGMGRGISAMVAELKDLREESRAQREALLRLIDRLPPPNDAPAT